MKRSQTNLALLFFLCICLGLLVAMCNRANSQPDDMLVGFFKHEADTTIVYLRFNPIPLPNKQTLKIVQTWRVHKWTGDCSYMANDYKMDGNSVVFPTSGTKWHTHFDLRTETLTVSFPSNTLVFYRAPPEENPIVDCSSESRDT